MSAVFLTAEWRHLAMANYAVDPALLRPHVPAGTELDFWNGTCFASLVAFRFLNTRVKGWRIPFHADFEEINLRFYVRRQEGAEWRRGVVFVKEIVPRPAIALVARWLYNENYVAMPTRHSLALAGGVKARYEWRNGGRWNLLEAEGEGAPNLPEPGSEPAFIAEHYWGYNAQRDGSTVEYRVDHPPWRVWTARSHRIDIDAAGLYGRSFAEALTAPPTSVFIAEGSPVTVATGHRL